MENEMTVHVIKCASPPYSEAVTVPPKSNEYRPPIDVHYQGFNQSTASSYPQSCNNMSINIQQPNSFTPQYNPPINYIIKSENLVYESESCLDSYCTWCFSIAAIIITAGIIRIIILAVYAR
ncbi:uncharacterized protein LOC143342906 [Colletes latitarsis]|uniref:uncharacterized protein LOC143342906 n=1 Tax=Colletes latitarsis TaxID=2605962 RepID=UPI004036FCA8